MASLEPDSAQIAWYAYDMSHGAGILVRQLCADLITGGPVKVFRKKATDDYTGWAVWGCSPVLGRLAIERPELFEGKRILELGAGCGVAGLAVACCTRAASICLSDYPTETLRNTLHNTALNCERIAEGTPSDGTVITAELGGVTYSIRDTFVARNTGCTVTLSQLDWTAEATWPRDADHANDGRPGAGFQQYDVILAADLLPRAGYGTNVAFVTRHLLRPGGLLIAVSPAVREGLTTLEEGLREARFSTLQWQPEPEESRGELPVAGAGGAPPRFKSWPPGEAFEHEVVEDSWRKNPLRRPLASPAHAPAPSATGAGGLREGSVQAEIARLVADGTTSAEAAGATLAAQAQAGGCSHPSWFGGAARAQPAVADPATATGSGASSTETPALAAAARALTAALLRAGGSGALRLVSDEDAVDMFPEMSRPAYDIVVATFQAPPL